MSGGGLGQGAVYSPLAQYTSDSDLSEEELHSNVQRLDDHAGSGKAVLSPKLSLKQHNGQSMAEYRPFGNEDAGYVSVNGIARQRSPTGDDVRILKPDGDQRSSTPMGPVRRACFVFSIAACFFTVVVFLWVLPCDWGVCPETCRGSATKSWERILNRLELKGAISVVAGPAGRGRNLVFMARCKVVDDGLPMTEDRGEVGSECGEQTDGGLVSLAGSDGSVAWWRPLRGLPRENNCSLVDVNGDGVYDCLVVGGTGLMAAVDPVTGAMLWRLKPTDSSIDELSFPLVLTDLDGDGVNDLLTSCVDRLLLVSGGTGLAMAPPYLVHSCAGVSGLRLGGDLGLSYSCGDGSPRVSTLRDLYSAMTNGSAYHAPARPPPRQHETAGGRRDHSVNGRVLTLDNQGRCPSPRCGVTVSVVDGGNGEVLWNYTAGGAHAMAPATILFPALANNGTTVSGFVLKFWQWGRATSSGGDQPPTGASVHPLRERVVLVTFNATDMHIVNASQNDVTQLCVGETLCQPDLDFQEQSLLIADLDQDGSQELVSYFTTYVSSGPDEMSGPWRLQSKIRAIRLEAELPKLYEAVARQ